MIISNTDQTDGRTACGIGGPPWSRSSLILSMYWDVCKQPFYRASREPARGTPVAGTDRPHEQMSDTDGPVFGDGPARVVRDFPDVAIRVGEGSGHASPLGPCRWPHDLPAGLLGLGK